MDTKFGVIVLTFLLKVWVHDEHCPPNIVCKQYLLFAVTKTRQTMFLQRRYSTPWGAYSGYCSSRSVLQAKQTQMLRISAG
jgi:hypothetical protein